SPGDRRRQKRSGTRGDPHDRRSVGQVLERPGVGGTEVLFFSGRKTRAAARDPRSVREVQGNAPSSIAHRRSSASSRASGDLQGGARARHGLRLPANASAGRGAQARVAVRFEQRGDKDGSRRAVLGSGSLYEVKAQTSRVRCSGARVRKPSKRENERGVF